MKRVPPSVRLKAEIERTLQGGEPSVGAGEPPMVGFVGRLARYMLQVAIEAEATAFLGREHYRRGARQRPGQACRALGSRRERSDGGRTRGRRDPPRYP